MGSLKIGHITIYDIFTLNLHGGLSRVQGTRRHRTTEFAKGGIICKTSYHMLRFEKFQIFVDKFDIFNIQILNNLEWHKFFIFSFFI